MIFNIFEYPAAKTTYPEKHIDFELSRVSSINHEYSGAGGRMPTAKCRCPGKHRFFQRQGISSVGFKAAIRG